MRMDFIKDITDFIFLEDEPQKADVIFVPGNRWPQPARRAAELYFLGAAPFIVVSGRYSKGDAGFLGPACEQERYDGSYRTEADFLTDVLLREGVPELAVKQECEAEYTLENAINIRHVLEMDGWQIGNRLCQPGISDMGKRLRRALICCQAFHARRCRMYFEYVFRDTAVEFLICPAVTQDISRDNWMDSKKGLDRVLGEMKRCGEQFSWMLTPEIIKDFHR